MKVFLVLRYHGEFCKVLKIFASRKDALASVSRLETKRSNPAITFHVIKKTIHGTLPLCFRPVKKVVRLDFKLAIKVLNQKNYIAKLESRIQELKASYKTSDDVLPGEHQANDWHPFDPLNGYSL